MFSATVRWGNSAKLWYTTPMPRRSVGRRATSWPSIRISPAIGRSSPRMHRNRVVFPPPEGPRIAASSPSRIPKLTSLRTSWPSKAIFSLRTSRVGMPWRSKGVVVEIRAESLLWNVWMILSTADLYQSEGRRGRATELAGVPAMAGPRSFRVTGIWTTMDETVAKPMHPELIGTIAPDPRRNTMATGGGTREPRPRERRGFAVPPRPVPGGPTRVEAAGREHGSERQRTVIPALPPEADGKAGARPPRGARRRVLRIPPEGHDGRGEPLPGNRAKHVRTAPEPRRASRRPCAAADGSDASWSRVRCRR